MDCLADPEYAMHEAARLGRQRSMLGVPLLHNGSPIGVIGLLRTVVKPFTEKQIELVTSFADQAVIAIENARLLSELRESLQEQTATSEVLQVISSSPGDLQPVFAAMLEKAVRICDATFGNIYRWDGDALQLVATHNTPPAWFKRAEAKAQARQAIRSKPRKLTVPTRSKIEAKLRQMRWSPEQISGWLSEQGIKLSHERIYQMIWDDKRDGGNLWRSLRRRGKRYNKRAGKNAGRGLIPNRIDISERPAIVARKTRLGDWEGDTVVSAGHKGGLLTLVERKTQLAKITKLPRATARATQKAAVRRLQPIGDFVHTITFDNGKEFAAHQDIAHALKTKIFFATPYHAWERGLNENTNGLIRDFFPKGTDFSTISSAEVAKVERLLNARPRKSLGFRSPQEVFHSLAYS